MILENLRKELQSLSARSNHGVSLLSRSSILPDRSNHFMARPPAQISCDGGTIQKRIELVKLAKKPEQADVALQRQLKWQHCALSKEILQAPVVVDDLGRLYRKESVLRWLLDRKSFGDGGEVAPHIESMKVS